MDKEKLLAEYLEHFSTLPSSLEEFMETYEQADEKGKKLSEDFFNNLLGSEFPSYKKEETGYAPSDTLNIPLGFAEPPLPVPTESLPEHKQKRPTEYKQKWRPYRAPKHRPGYYKEYHRKKKEKKSTSIMELNKLIKIANQLDQRGLYEEASAIDIIIKHAIDRDYFGFGPAEEQKEIVLPESGMTPEQYKKYYGKEQPKKPEDPEEMMPRTPDLVEKSNLTDDEARAIYDLILTNQFENTEINMQYAPEQMDRLKAAIKYNSSLDDNNAELLKDLLYDLKDNDFVVGTFNTFDEIEEKHLKSAMDKLGI